MNISKETLAIFKNFASINSNLLLKKGNVMSTMAANRTILASVTIPESFDEDFGIYDLNEFLGALSLFNSPELKFEPKYVTIKEGSERIRFFSADPSVLLVPTKKVEFPDPEIEFVLSAAQYAKIQRTASVLRSPDLIIQGDKGKLSLVVADKKNVTGNSFSAELDKTDKEFKVNINISNLKMLPGDYRVAISSKRISKFQSIDTDLLYYCAVESDSVFAE